MVDVDSTCSVRISSLADEECPPPEIRALEDEYLLHETPMLFPVLRSVAADEVWLVQYARTEH